MIDVITSSANLLVTSKLCSDYALAGGLSVIQQVFTMLCTFVPIILIVMASVQLLSYLSNPEQKEMIKRLSFKFLAAVLVFFLPYITNVFMSWLPSDKFNVSACWSYAAAANEKITLTNYISGNVGVTSKRGSLLGNLKGLSAYKEKASSNGGSASPSTGDGTILLLAGHSYRGYCEKAGNECREMLSSGYNETDQTRILVKLIKSELDALGVKSDIGNAIISGDNDRMPMSFYSECSTGSAACGKGNWTKYKYVLEIHFNASGGASGTLVCRSPGYAGHPIDQEIVKAVTKHTGKIQREDYVTGLFDYSFFASRNIPITYLETEFFDNRAAMLDYHAKKDVIAKDIAALIKKYYG